MEPDVVRLYSSSPPPLDEVGEEEEQDEFGEFGSFCGGEVSSSSSFLEIDTPTTFNQSNALEDSPPDLSVQDLNVSGKTVRADENKLVGESQQPCVVSIQETSKNETEKYSCVEKKEKDSSEIFMNGVPSSDLQRELIISSSDQHCLPLPTCIGDNSTGEHIDNTVDGHSGLSNGYSMYLEHDIDSSVSSELDVRISEEQSLPLSNSHSYDKDTSDREDTEVRVELCNDFQLLTSCGDAEDAEGTEETGSISVSSSHVNGDGSTNSKDTAGAATSPSTDMDLISDTQLTGETTEIHESSINIETGIEADNAAFNETSNEDFGDFRDATQGLTDFSRTESVTQEGFADFVTAMSRCSTDDEFVDADTLKDFQEEDELVQEDSAGDEGAFCSELPPSDSFADFSSAPFVGLAVDEGENWASFGQQKSGEEVQDSWATFGEEEESTLQYEEKQDGVTSAPLNDNFEITGTDRDTAEFCSKIQHLFSTAFPLDVNPEISEVTEVSLLQNILQEQDPQDKIDASISFSQGHDLAMWRHLQDIHGAHGLKFKWAGSHSNRLLLDCLGIRNILFTGEKKQPIIVPMFAAGLGMLEPTRESQKSLASPALSSPVPVESGSILCTQLVPSLTIHDDGIDPELYELTTAKMETKSAGHSITDAFTKLIESMEKTTTARKPEQNEKISEEASKIISLLPDLSFMRARVLMFPSTLTPAANHK
ncbi:aftiphilin isoform X2 [Triplophysa dalaica]|uniref:aftiphilin isoform X2 n=1 Tax=Triplophysa dalaica TaxID=1582913 RepID=UPI0024DFABEE|nr:aftiphilin isoform X2 [Triplophysa dalaica]